MKVLQIATGFSYSSVYESFFLELNRRKVNIEVYVPQHADSSIDDLEEELYPYPIYSNKVIKSYDKLLYFTKIKRMQKDIEKNYTLSLIKLIHAHSLFSDGGVAYELYKKYQTPYIVAIRDTDVNQYFKKAKHLKPYALKILENASKIIFLSKTYRDNVLNTFVPTKIRAFIREKSEVIPNGISEFWIENIYNDRPEFNPEKEEINLIFVGQIIKRKNIESIIKARNSLRKMLKTKINILVVGKIKDKAYYKYLTNLGEFTHIEHCSPNELIDFYRNADVFVMTSLTETFGLVYAEALSQALPVIYTSGQGFDCQFKEGVVGYRVQPIDIQDISKKIHKIIKNYDNISLNCRVNASKFDWRKISSHYVEIYKKIVNI